VINKERHIRWEAFKQSIEQKIPAEIRILGEPVVDLFIDKEGKRIGLHTSINSVQNIPATPLQEICLNITERDKKFYLEIYTENEELFKEFYHFMLVFADKVQIDKINPYDAFYTNINRWKELISQKTLLSQEKLLGLIGELWLLKRLIEKLGVKSLTSWVGPFGEAHDFRLNNNEIEVKSTRGEKREHIINGANQLTASPNKSLYLLSLIFSRSGNAEEYSLLSLVLECKVLLEGNYDYYNKFNRILTNVFGINDDHLKLYTEKFQFRRQPALIPIEICPRISEEKFNLLFTNDPNRIIDLNYKIDVEGLGFLDNSQEFLNIIP
jgi:hypothetical protein